MLSILKETLLHHYKHDEFINTYNNIPDDVTDAVKLWIICNVHVTDTDDVNNQIQSYDSDAVIKMIYDDIGLQIHSNTLYYCLRRLDDSYYKSVFVPGNRKPVYKCHKKYKFDSKRIGKTIWISKIVRSFIEQLYNIEGSPTIKNIFIAQQMFCLSDSEVRIARNTIKYFAKKRYGDDVNFIDQYNVPDDELAPSDTKQPRLHYLGRSIKMLSNADLVIFHGNAKTEFTGGCAIEKHICEEYDIPYIYSEELFYNGGDI